MYRIRHSGDSEIHSVIPPSPERRTSKLKKAEKLYSGVRSRLKVASPDGGEVSTSSNETKATTSTEMEKTQPRRNPKPAPTAATAKATAKLAAQRNSRRALSPTESTAAASASSLATTPPPVISKNVVSTPPSSKDDSLYNPTLSSSGRSATRRMLAQSKELLHDRNSIQEGKEFTSPMDNPGKSRRLKAEDLGDDSVDSIHFSSPSGRNKDDEDDELFGDFSEFNNAQRRKQRQPSPRTSTITSSKATRTTKKAETLSMSTNTATKNNFSSGDDDDDYSFRRTPGRQQRLSKNGNANKGKEPSTYPTTSAAAIADVDWNKITGDDATPTTSDSKNNKDVDEYMDEFMTLQSRGSSVSSISRGSYSRGGTPRSSPTANGSDRKISGGRKKAEDLENTTSIHGGDDEDNQFMSPRKSQLSGVSHGRKKKAEDLGTVTSIHGGDDEEDDEFRVPRKSTSSTSARRSSGRKKRAEDLGSVTSIHGGDDDDDDENDDFDRTSPFSSSSSRKTKSKFGNGNSGRKKKAEDLGSVTSIHGGDEEEEDDFSYRARRAGGGSRYGSSHSGRRPAGGRKKAEDLGSVTSIHGGDEDDDEEFEHFSVSSRRKHSSESSSSRRKKAEDLGNVTSIYGDDDEEEEEDEKKEKDVDEYDSPDYGIPRRSTVAKSTGRKKAESLDAVTSIHGGEDEIELSYGAKTSYESSPVNRTRAAAAAGGRITTNSHTTTSPENPSKTAAIFQIRQKLVDVLNDIDTLSLEGSTKFNAKDLRAMNGIRTKVVDAIDDIGGGGGSSNGSRNDRAQHVQQIRQKLSKALMELDSMP